MKFFLFFASLTTVSAQGTGLSLGCGTGGPIKIAGSSTVEPIAMEWAAGFSALCPGTTFTVDGGGSSTGARRVCNQTSAGTAVEIGNMSREWSATEVNVTGTKKFVCNIGTRGRPVTQIDVAIDGVTIALNAGTAAQCIQGQTNGVGLTIDQLRWMYSNYSKAQLIQSGWSNTAIPFDDLNETSHKWNEMFQGPLCPNGEIKLSSPGLLSGTYTFFKEIVLPNATEGLATKRPDGILQSEVDEDLVLFVEFSSEVIFGDAVGYFGFSFFVNEGNNLYGVPIQAKGATAYIAPSLVTLEAGTYVPFGRRIYMNVYDPSFPQTAPFIEYGLNQAGIGLITKAGFIPPPFGERATIVALVGGKITAPVPTKPPTRPPVVVPPSVPVSPVAPPSQEPCGLLNLSIFCPLTFCGIFGRLLGLCRA
jgi:ABC-type phosphate transport system substrate-binding protein